jgi:hypothetical protein
MLLKSTSEKRACSYVNSCTSITSKIISITLYFVCKERMLSNSMLKMNSLNYKFKNVCLLGAIY